MIDTNFDIYSKNQTAAVIPSEIKASFDGATSFLEVFIHFTYRYPTECFLDILTVSARLILSGKNCLLSHSNISVGLTVPRAEYSNGEWFKFSLEEKLYNVSPI